MNGFKKTIKALSIVIALTFSFVLPAVIMPVIEASYQLSEFTLELTRSLLAAFPTFSGLLAVFLYHNFDTVYIFVNRTWLWISNSAVSWSVSVEYFGNFEAQVLEKIYQNLLRTYRDAAPVSNTPLEKLVNLPMQLGGVVQLKYIKGTGDEGLLDDSTELLLKVLDLNVPFRKSESAIEELDRLLTDVVEETLKGSRAKYTFRINFNDANPYYGLFLQKQRVLAKDVRNFSCGFIDRHGGCVLNCV